MKCACTPHPSSSRCTTTPETPRHKWTGVLIGSPAVAFAFGIIASQFRAVSGRPSVGRASCSNGTSPFTREASPTADVDGSYHIPMPYPSAFCTDIGTISCFVSGATSRTFLGGIGRVYLLYLDAKPFRFIGDECGQLGEAPTIFHAVVFAGGCPTTCACRALAYTLQGFNLDGPHALLVGMIDDLSRELVVDVLHPSCFFALALFDGTCLLCLLQLLATSIEPTSHLPLIASIAKEAAARANDIGHSRYLDAQINTHHAVLFHWLGRRDRHREISYPLASFLLDAQDARKSLESHISTSNLDLLRLAVQAYWQGESPMGNLPVLIVPLTDGLLEHGQTVQFQGPLEDRTRIP